MLQLPERDVERLNARLLAAERRARRRVRRAILLTGGAGALAVAVLAAALVERHEAAHFLAAQSASQRTQIQRLERAVGALQQEQARLAAEAQRAAALARTMSPMLALSPDHTAMVAGSGWIVAADEARPLRQVGSDLRLVRYSADGARFVALDGDNGVTLYDQDGAPVARLPQRGVPVTYLGLSPDGARTIVLWEDGDVMLWSARLGLSTRLHGLGPLTFVAFSADGDRILGVSQDGEVGLWEGDSGRLVQRRPAADKFPVMAAFSDDGAEALLGYRSGRIEVWTIGKPGHQASYRGVLP